MIENLRVGHPDSGDSDSGGAVAAGAIDGMLLGSRNPIQTKAAAKSLAQTLTHEVDDRRLRQTIRTGLYRELLPLLQQLGDARTALERRVQQLHKLVAALAIGLLVCLAGLLSLLL